MFDTVVALGNIGVQILVLVLFLGLITKQSFIKQFARYAHYILVAIFSLSVVVSLIYSDYFGFAPCILCWYQRIAIFGILILLFTEDITKSSLLRKQIFVFAGLGSIVALIHVTLELFPNANLEVCGTDGVSCSIQYVQEFGYVTVPVMSLAALLSAIIITFVAKRYPQN